MSPVITRMEVVSAAGYGVAALIDVLNAGQPLIRRVPWEEPHLKSPFAACANLGDAQAMLKFVVNAVRPIEDSVGLIVGTSSGAISGRFEDWMSHGEKKSDERFWRQEPTLHVCQGFFPVTTLSLACASGTVGFDLARRWLALGVVQRVVVASVDALSRYIHVGFAGLGALGVNGSQPFTANRDGLLLGEGAAAFLVETETSAIAAGRIPLARLAGTAISQDGKHLTAPDQTGDGLARCIRLALQQAGIEPDELDAVSAHGTGTLLNDKMEIRAYAQLFQEPIPLHAIKPVIGHALGAAGGLEAAVVLAGLGGASLPPPPADEFEGVLFRSTQQTHHALSVNAAFGGVNAAVVFSRYRPADEQTIIARPITCLHKSQWSGNHFPLTELWPEASPALGRTDHYVRAMLKVIQELRSFLEPNDAVVLSSNSACRAADLRYYRGVLERGAAGASRLSFPYTIPGAPLAEGAILAGLRGPALVLCDTCDAGQQEAQRWVASGEVRRAVAVHIEAPENGIDAEAWVSQQVYE